MVFLVIISLVFLTTSHTQASEIYPTIGIPLEIVQYASVFMVSFSLGAWMLRERYQHTQTVKNKQNFSTISWRDFEELAGEYYRKKGYSVQVVGGSGGDGGIDLIAKKRFRKTIVQCKHWKNKIGVSIVREMFGVMHAESAHRVVIICSGQFTSEAIAFAEGKPIELVDGPTFIKRLNK